MCSRLPWLLAVLRMYMVMKLGVAREFGRAAPTGKFSGQH